jgi:phosphoglycolate phosphatase-like HAD superfamily hydrolase
MQTFGIKDPARVAKVGDTPADLQEGTNASCGWVIGLTSGSHTRTELAAHPHTHLVDDLWDVVQVISNHPASGPKSGN